MPSAIVIARHEQLVPKGAIFSSLDPAQRHVVSRSEKPESYPDRGHVPDDFGPGYSPTHFVHPNVAAQPAWAEPLDFQEALRIRATRANREPHELFPSYETPRLVEGRPMNPRGPTGITGQGLLGKHGPNFACDPIVFRRHLDPGTGFHKLQMIAIQRRDNGKWAIPGGMADYGETVSGTLARELREEALGEGVPEERSQAWEAAFQKMFSEHGFQVYCGAVDDSRNTDTSWMETSVWAFEMTAKQAEELDWDMTLRPGDDAQDALWMDLNEKNLSALNANHGDFVARAVQLWQEHTNLVVRKDGIIGPSAIPN
jgi:ADP-ribose diphosphatase